MATIDLRLARLVLRVTPGSFCNHNLSLILTRMVHAADDDKK